MTIKIGDKSYTTRRPQTLDKQLLEETGCDSGEIARQLAGEPSAGLVARALLAFLPEGDRPGFAALATDIDAAGTLGIAAQVGALYASSGADDLDGKKVAELRTIADDETIDLGDAKRHDDIVAAIRAARLARLTAAADAE